MLYEKKKNEKTNHRLGEKYFQIICPIQDLYPEYIKNLKRTQFKNGQDMNKYIKHTWIANQLFFSLARKAGFIDSSHKVNISFILPLIQEACTGHLQCV